MLPHCITRWSQQTPATCSGCRTGWHGRGGPRRAPGFPELTTDIAQRPFFRKYSCLFPKKFLFTLPNSLITVFTRLHRTVTNFYSFTLLRSLPHNLMTSYRSFYIYTNIFTNLFLDPAWPLPHTRARGQRRQSGLKSGGRESDQRDFRFLQRKFSKIFRFPRQKF